MNFELSAEQRQLVDAIKKVRLRDIAPRALQSIQGGFPHDNIKSLAAIGVMGMAIPERFGGTDASILDTVLALEEISKACYVTAEAVIGEIGVQSRIISTYAPEHLKERYLPRIASGDGVLSICMTEPDAGTDVASYRTSSRIVGDRVIVKGAKTLISRAVIADVLIVFTRVNDIPGAAGIGCVLVPKGTPGLNAKATYRTMAGDHLCDVTFDECEVPLDHLLLKENSMKTLMNAFNAQRCLNAAICLGLAEGALEEATRYMRDRKAFGQRIGDFQGLRWKAADMLIEIEAARGLLYRAAVSAKPFPEPVITAAAKIYCNEMCIRVTSAAVQVHGGYGFTDEFAVSRFFRGARYGSLGGGTTETLRNYLGRHLVEHVDLATGVAIQ
jgi:alkylation response protein AidB-like acyl-CoA dehydrogenase